MRRAFDSMDIDGDQQVSYEEMRSSDYFAHASDDELRVIFKRMDVSLDNQVSFEVLLRMHC